MKDVATTLALTLIQPWATLIVRGPKRIENRVWHPPEQLIGSRIWIHAGKTYDDDAALDVTVRSMGRSDNTELADLCNRAERELGVILGSAKLIGAVRAGPEPGAFTRNPEGLTPSARQVLLKSEKWFVGPWGWVLDEVRALGEPVPCRGAQKLWTVPADVLERLGAQA